MLTPPKAFLAVICLICLALAALSQNKDMDKIAPYFRLMINEQKANDIEKKKGCGRRSKKVKKNVSSDLNHNKKFDCIVYTKKPEALRKKRITINSVLPTFVTAVATLNEILLMASMEEVTFIEAPSIDNLHKDDTSN